MPPAAPAHNGFSRVLAAEAISNFGSMLSRLAIPWLAVLHLQATPLQMAWLGLADVAAAAAGSLLLGGWVDRRGKRQVMLLCDGLRCALLLAVALAAWRGWVTLGGLLLAAAAGGVLTLAFELARSAWMAQRLAPSQLVQGNARLSMVASLSETAAFAAGGWLFQGLGAALALVVDGLSYLASALCLRRVREAPPLDGVPATPPASRAGPPRAPPHGLADASADVPPRPPLLQALRALSEEASAGLKLVAGHAVLRALAGIEGLLALARGLVTTAVMIYITRDLAVPPGQQGLIFATGALGAIAGAALAERLGHRLGPGRAMALGLAAFTAGLACVPLAGATAFADLPLAVAALLVLQQVVGDAGHTLHEVHDRTLRQTAVGPQWLARADAGIRAVGQAAMLLGLLAGGLLGDALGARIVLWAAVGAGLAAALLAALTLGRRGAAAAAAAAPDTPADSFRRP